MHKAGKVRTSRFFFAMALFSILFSASGCAYFQTNKAGSGPPPESKQEKEKQPLYYDFGDVLIPRELQVIKDKSFVFRTPGLSAGVLALKGNVEVNSLIAFFETNMAKDNWRPVSSFKSPRSMMLFQKENRWCVINITDESFSTYVEIWVAPTMTASEEGLLK